MTQPGGEGGNSGEGGSGGVQTVLFTQEQVNSAAAESKRKALSGFWKDLGFDTPPDNETVQAVFKDAGEYAKIKKGEQTDVQRLTDELQAANQKAAVVPEKDAVILRQRLAADAKIPSKLWKFVEGKTEDEIAESIKDLKETVGLADDGDGDGASDDGKQKGGGTVNNGTGRPPAQNEQQGRNNGGGSPKKTLASGREYYESKKPKSE